MKDSKETAEFILNMLHDTPRKPDCRYYSGQECLYEYEDEEGLNWCNNCVCWHTKVASETGAETIYHKYPNATALHASMLKEVYEGKKE